MGRHSSYTDEVADIILRRIAGGESLTAICRDDDMPDRETVRRWEGADPAFAARCAAAREAQGDSYVDKMDDVCIRLDAGDMTSDVARVLLANMQWKASKLNRSRYGEKVTNEHTGKDGGPIQTAVVTVNAEEAKAINASLENEC